jgi:hypothetical protein
MDAGYEHACSFEFVAQTFRESARGKFAGAPQPPFAESPCRTSPPFAAVKPGLLYHSAKLAARHSPLAGRRNAR